MLSTLLLLLITANGAPIIARTVFGRHWSGPLDRGGVLADGARVLGDSKTARGLLAAVIGTTALAQLFGLGWQIGAVIGALAMLGDLLSSFVKRRLALPSGTSAPGLDHVPESLIPLLACRTSLELSLLDIALLTVAFMLADLLLSRVLYRLGFGGHPY